MKKCGKCGAEKPLTEFHFRKERDNYYSQCKACWAAKGRAFLAANPEKNKQYYRGWKMRDPERVREVQREMKARQRSRPERKLAMYVSTAIAIALSGARKRAPTFEMLGYTRDDLMAHLERQFHRGMSWENYGEWHVDHIRPLSGFDFSNQDAVLEAWALSNLRPLWAKENIAKKDRRVLLV